MGKGSRYTGVERYEGPEGVRWIARASKRIEGGKRVFWEQAFATETAANKARRAWLYAQDNGVMPDATKMTVGDALTIWLESHGPRLAATTRSSYAATVRVHLMPSPLAAIPLAKLTAATIQQWYNRLEVGARTKEMVHLRLCQALDLAVKHRLLAHNYARDCEVPRSRPRRGVALEQAQVVRFLAHAALDHYHPLWHLALATGLRRAELLGLRWADVDVDRRLLLIRQTTVWLDGRPKVQERTKTPSSARGVLVDAGTMAMLTTHKAAQSRRQDLAGDAWQQNDLVFCSATGTPLGAPNVHRTYKRLLAAADIPASTTIHHLRHTHLSHLIDAGVPIATVAERGGYRNPTTLLNVYVHAYSASQEAAADASAQLLAGGDGEADKTKSAGGETAGK